ncbi:MAG: hypothetical protein R2692_00685 [Microbacterium sp.]
MQRTFAAGILFGALKAVVLDAGAEIPVDIVLVVQSLIVLFIAAPPLRAPCSSCPDRCREGRRRAPRRPRKAVAA